MRLDERDAALLWDMQEACREMLQFVAGVGHEEFVENRMLCLAVERCLEIVGEAAGDVSPEFCKAHPEILWRKVAGMRHVLAHDYGAIDYGIVYQTVTKEVPRLLKTLVALLATR